MEKQLTNSERHKKRREDTRSRKYIDMTNKELREENNKEITDPETIKRSIGTQQGKFLTDALKAYMRDDTEYLEKHCSDRLIEYVKMIYNNAKNNSSFIQEINNRIEGKVKDEVIIENKIANHIPDQNKSRVIRDKYKVPEKSDKDAKTLQ
jgi:hypothetical protein